MLPKHLNNFLSRFQLLIPLTSHSLHLPIKPIFLKPHDKLG